MHEPEKSSKKNHKWRDTLLRAIENNTTILRNNIQNIEIAVFKGHNIMVTCIFIKYDLHYTLKTKSMHDVRWFQINLCGPINFIVSY